MNGTHQNARTRPETDPVVPQHIYNLVIRKAKEIIESDSNSLGEDLHKSAKRLALYFLNSIPLRKLEGICETYVERERNFNWTGIDERLQRIGDIEVNFFTLYQSFKEEQAIQMSHAVEFKSSTHKKDLSPQDRKSHSKSLQPYTSQEEKSSRVRLPRVTNISSPSLSHSLTSRNSLPRRDLDKPAKHARITKPERGVNSSKVQFKYTISKDCTETSRAREKAQILIALGGVPGIHVSKRPFSK